MEAEAGERSQQKKISELNKQIKDQEEEQVPTLYVPASHALNRVVIMYRRKRPARATRCG